MHNGFSPSRRAWNRVMTVLVWAAAVLVMALVAGILGMVLVRGVPHISWNFLTTTASVLKGTDGILPAILNTLYVILLTLLIVLPLGVGAAVYLTEYASNRRLIEVIEFTNETLAGIPSILYGLVGMLVFSQALGFQTCLLSGSLTLVVMNLPTIIRTTQESLKTVPQGYREGALGLGAGKWHIIRTIVLPCSIDGIVTGCILAVGRIVGESAALLFTAGAAEVIAKGVVKAYTSNGATLSVLLYLRAFEDGDFASAWGIGAVLLGVAVPLLRMAFGASAQWVDWVYRALTFLVVSCPCALVISIPLSFFAGIGGASREGILIKGSNYLETLAQTKYVVFDKTGTLTKGVFEVVGVHHNTMEEKKILEYAALAESFSSHPISRSLKTAYGKEIDQKRVTDVEEISGNGVTAKVDGISVAVGNTKLMKRIGVEAVECHQVGTVIHVAIDGAYAGHILISDVLKPTSKEAIVNLKKNGIKETVMLTGDIDKVAQQVAGELGVDRVYSELLPADKVSKVEELLAKKTEKEKLAFVGDGINDAPVLSRADIGIAMGAMGSDAAIEAADVVLMDDDPMKIVKAIRIAKKCMRIVYENIYFAIGIKVICLLLGAVGIANMWVAIFADVGVMIIAVLNAIRTLFVKKL